MSRPASQDADSKEASEESSPQPSPSDPDLALLDEIDKATQADAATRRAISIHASQPPPGVPIRPGSAPPPALSDVAPAQFSVPRAASLPTFGAQGPSSEDSSVASARSVPSAPPPGIRTSALPPRPSPGASTPAAARDGAAKAKLATSRAPSAPQLEPSASRPPSAPKIEAAQALRAPSAPKIDVPASARAPSAPRLDVPAPRAPSAPQREPAEPSSSMSAPTESTIETQSARPERLPSTPGDEPPVSDSIIPVRIIDIGSSPDAPSSRPPSLPRPPPPPVELAPGPRPVALADLSALAEPATADPTPSIPIAREGFTPTPGLPPVMYAQPGMYAPIEPATPRVERPEPTGIEMDMTPTPALEPVTGRISEIPPEVDPADLEVSSTQAPVRPPAPPPFRLPPSLMAPAAPTGAGGGASAAASAPPPVEALSYADMSPGGEPPTGVRKRYWWEELFTDDFLRTMKPMSERELKAEATFIEERLGLEKDALILDLACGAGRQAVELVSRGYNVVGYDLSLAMLARAADEAQERQQKINFLQGDMRELAFEEAFDAVYCWTTSFGYFDDDKNAAVAQRVFKALRHGGLFLLDVINRDFVAKMQPELIWFEGEGCVCMDDARLDFFNSRLKVKRTVMLDDGRAREIDYSMRVYSLHEIGRLLHDAGFRVTEVTGRTATPGVFMGVESPRIIVLAEKP